MMMRCFGLLMIGLFAAEAHAHHVLGRPAYSLNEDSNTPSSMTMETQIGDYFVHYMVFPAFPKPGEPGRINLYASHMDTGQAPPGKVLFEARDAGWFADDAEFLGRQALDDAVYHQGFQFTQAGDYIITASFEDNGEPYIIDFPLRVGALSGTGPIGITLGLIALALVAVNLLQRRRLLKAKIRGAHEETDT